MRGQIDEGESERVRGEDEAEEDRGRAGTRSGDQWSARRRVTTRVGVVRAADVVTRLKLGVVGVRL
jgi:hypothetical protein